jgi:hypothetical protein
VASPWLFYGKEKVMKLLNDELFAALLAKAKARKHESGPFDPHSMGKCNRRVSSATQCCNPTA